MAKEIDIIIPAYNAHKTITKTLNSIAVQSISDFCKITVVNDAGDNYSNILKDFKKSLDIEEISYKINKGPGVARQFGIDNTTLPYILFIDADDILGDFLTLDVLLGEIEANSLDIVCGSFIEEVNNPEKAYINHNEDHTWMHGKIYRRDYLESIDLKFTDLRKNEDATFNMVAFCLTKKFKHIDYPSYFWKRAENSITSSEDYQLTGYEGWCKGNIYAVRKLEGFVKDGKLDKIIIAEIVTNAIVLLYLEYNWFLQTRSPDMVKKFLTWVKDLYINIVVPYEGDISGSMLNEFFLIYQRKTIRPCSNVLPLIGFNDFLNLVRN